MRYRCEGSGSSAKPLGSKTMKVALKAALLGLTIWHAAAVGEARAETIVIQNYYWAKAGKAQQVYEHRLHASEVRRKLGLPAGRVLKRSGADGEGPDVIWECEYASERAREEDLRALADSGAFEAVTGKMGTLIDRFERGMYVVNQ